MRIAVSRERSRKGTGKEVVIVVAAQEVGEAVAAPCRNCLSRTLVLRIRPGRQELLCGKCEATTRVDIEERDGDLVVRATLVAKDEE